MCIMSFTLCSCIFTPYGLWYDYNFGNKPRFYYASKKQSLDVLALRYNNRTYVSTIDTYIVTSSSTEDYDMIGYLQGSFIGSMLMGVYVLYTYSQDVNKDFILQCRNKSKSPVWDYCSEDTIESFYDTPIIKIDDLVLDSNVTINDLKDEKTTSTFSDSLSCQIFIDEQYDFINYIYFWNFVYYEDEVLYIRTFDVKTYNWDYYTIKSQYYWLFESVIQDVK